MSLDWANERYVRAYTRDTAEMLCWPWESRAIWWLLVRKADRSGLIPVPPKLGVRGLAALIAMPPEVVIAGVAGLLEDGCFREVPGGYLIPNYIEAQETPASDAKRQRDQRERRRAGATGENHSDDSHEASPPVTSRHVASRDVTPNRTVPFRSEPCLAEPNREREPSPPAQGDQPATATPVLALVAQEQSPKAARKQANRPLPAEWVPSIEHLELARELGVDAGAEATNMRDWAAAKGERKADWNAAFRGWLRRSAESKSRAGPRGGAPWRTQNTAGGDLPRLLDDIERMEREERRS